MSIFSADEIKNYLMLTKGISAPEATLMQTAVLAYEALGYFTAKDAAMISACERPIRVLMDIFHNAGTYTYDELWAMVAFLSSLPKYMRHFVQEAGMQEYVGKISPAEVV
jgi:hypothetical protein